MLRVTFGVHRVLSATNELPPVTFDELGLVESQLERPSHGVDRPSFHVPAPFPSLPARHTLSSLCALLPSCECERFDRSGDRLLASPTVRVLGPGPRHWELLRETIEDGQVRGGLLTDAVIVALCRESGVGTVLSAGPGFRRFSSVTWEHLG